MSAPTQSQSMPLASLPAPTAGAKQPAAVQSLQNHQPLMELDAYRLRSLDANRPFSGLQDAVERLMPFHAFAAMDPSEADAQQAAEENLQITAGRRDTWDRQQAQVAFELADRIDKLAEQVGQVKMHIDSGAASHAEDRLALERHLHADAQARLDALKRQRAQQAQEEADRRAAAAAAEAVEQQVMQEPLTLI